jgi:hypothetical protein
MQVGESSRPVFREDEFHRVDADGGVEYAIKFELLEADLLEQDLGMLCSRPGEHAGRLIDPDDRSAGRQHHVEIAAGAARRIEDRATRRT